MATTGDPSAGITPEAPAAPAPPSPTAEVAEAAPSVENPATGIIAPDDSETDSAVNVSIRDSLTSIRSSILHFEDEYGRLYHSHSRGKYYFPHDNDEQDRLDLQHELFVRTLRGQLCTSPKARGASRVLDLGTGTGIWALEYAEEHPEAEVIGVDISPVQPSFTPPNCSFEIDDIEKPWTWSKQFDFIFSRTLSGSILDPAKLVDSIYNQLEPGGYFEGQDVCMEARTDDNTLPAESSLARWADEVVDAMDKIGRTLRLCKLWKQLLVDRGFEDVREVVYKWPTNTWPRDRMMKEIGGWGLANLDSFLETAALGTLTNIKGWSREEVLVMCSEARREMRDPSIHVWWPVYVVTGRKPGGSSTPPPTA
ncbi:Secondary metabolism regulator LAE1 [Colletotrichum orbiculare MAFF 240422]|uniref:Secondary metabolism regulator LAE1 n=1 Tax=Colletotrichum orbiculare (strain 104-T / ATCC 96160 / CBS 514.97 / LARS 414 / MAFF 240422) TaxID=1213857 RepID=N4VKV4_COLOR|nr:Secondary metabolism regulator LAE1 [Colletotrichum orbiculare MAFF 240422]